MVAAMVMAPPLTVATNDVHAAPMSGVVFVEPVRVFDSTAALPAARYVIPPTSFPPNSSEVLLQITLVPGATSTGVVMAHDCAVPANPATDVVLPIEPGADIATNQVYVPQTTGVCITTTAAVPRVAVDLLGSVMPSGGASYVDLPFSYVTTVVGPVDSAPIDLSGFGVPTDPAGYALWLDAFSPDAGFASVFPCGQQSLSSQADFPANTPTTSLVAGVATGPSGLCIRILGHASVDISIDGYYKVGAQPTPTSPPQIRYTTEPAPGFVGLTPTRLFDTRSGGAPVTAGHAYHLDISAFVPVDTTAIVMNVTVTQPSASGFVTVYPCDGTQPETSSLNFVAGQTVPNLVTVDASFGTDICFFTSATTHLLADLAGYYIAAAGDGFAPSPPVRMFDTRKTGKVQRGSVFSFDMTPFVAADASSAVFNLTATDVDGAGFVTAYPCGQDPPVASNLNVSLGQTVPNLVTVALPSNKRVCFFTSAGTNLIGDLAGWYAASAPSGFIVFDPARWADTRDAFAAPVAARSVFSVSFGADFPDATAVVLNSTVTEPQSAGFLTVYPCADDPPLASNVNFVADQSVPNMVISAVDAVGDVCIFNSAPTHWILDLSGYFTDSAQFVFFFPDGSDIL